MCNLQTRHYFQTNSRDLVDGVTNELHLSKGIPSVSVNFISCQEVVISEVGML